HANRGGDVPVLDPRVAGRDRRSRGRGLLDDAHRARSVGGLDLGRDVRWALDQHEALPDDRATPSSRECVSAQRQIPATNASVWRSASRRPWPKSSVASKLPATTSAPSGLRLSPRIFALPERRNVRVSISSPAASYEATSSVCCSRIVVPGRLGPVSAK